MDKSWKAFERAVAKAVGGRRVPVTGIDRDGADVDGGPFQYQVKLGRRKPAYLTEWLTGIVSSASRKGATGIVIWKQPGERIDDSLVVMRLRDWADWHGV